MKKIAWAVIALIFCAEVLWGATKIRSATIINSTLDSSPVGSATPSTGVFTTLTDQALTSGQCVQAASGGILQGIQCPYTNGGRQTSVCSTAGGGGSTCTSSVSFFRTEADTNYAISVGCVGPSQFPLGLAVTSKGTSSATVQITNGTNNEAQISTCSELDVTLTR